MKEREVREAIAESDRLQNEIEILQQQQSKAMVAHFIFTIHPPFFFRLFSNLLISFFKSPINDFCSDN
jgi:hypothetical protein